MNVLSLNETILGELKHILDIIDVWVKYDANLAPLLYGAPIHDVRFKAQSHLEHMQRLRIQICVLIEVGILFHKEQITAFDILIDHRRERDESPAWHEPDWQIVILKLNAQIAASSTYTEPINSWATEEGYANDTKAADKANARDTVEPD